MRVYLVRHGETLYNRNYTHQHAEVVLSERGKDQARRTGMRLRGVPQPLLVTSDLARTRETADIIGKIIGTVPREEPLFREMKRPSQMVGTFYYGFTSLTIGLQLLLHAPYASWHYADEENLHDIRTRVALSIKYLESIADRYAEVIVVSHAVFIQLFLTQLRNKKISLLAYLGAILKLVPIDNASITTLTCTPQQNGEYVWSIERINERDHLMEETAGQKTV